MNPTEDLCSIFLKALEKVDPYLMILDRMRMRGGTLHIEGEGASTCVDLNGCREILVTGIGKASAKMAAAAIRILGDRVSGGAVITKYGQAVDLDRVRVLEAGHPVPDGNSVRWADELCRMASAADRDTLILNLVSGGGSALFSLPRDGISLEDLQETTKTLLASGAGIREINCIRKHLSRVKGGGFARAAFPARMINLILSDVMGDPVDAIASGITAPDSTTFGQALSVVEKYGIASRLPARVMETLLSGARGLIPETPKPGDPVFDRVTNIILGNNTAACRGARDYGRELGYRACLLTSSLTGEAREMAHLFASLARDIRRGASDLTRPALVVAGGETTVTLRGNGKGGRNQEMALSFLEDMLDATGSLEDVYFLSAGTDGIDGPTDAAGALVHPGMQRGIEEQGLRPGAYLKTNDSYRFFQKTEGLLVTGPTDTNVCDLQLLIVA